MLKCKEIKGTVQNPDIDKAVSDFFSQCNENVVINSINYSTAALPFKTQSNGVSYQIVSSCLIIYDEYEE